MFHLMKAVAVLASALASVSGFPQLQASNSATTPENWAVNIEGCGADTGILLGMITKGLAALQPALKDVDLGSKSPRFKAMFKDGATSTYVKGILRSISSLEPVKDLLPDPYVPSRPRFACASPGSFARYKFLSTDPYVFCIQPGAGQALYIMHTSYIFICPSFWAGQAEPKGSNCPSVVNNRFVGHGEFLGYYSTYLLIHEMTHFYMQEASLGTHTDPPEIYPLNQCVFSDALISIHNPQNYQFYVALVQQGCIEAPDPDIPPYLIPANDTIPTNVSSPTTSPPASLVDLYADPLGVFPSLATTPPGIFSLDSGSVRGVVSPEITLSRYPASVQASTVGILELLPAPSLVALDPIDREIGDNNSNPIVAIS